MQKYSKTIKAITALFDITLVLGISFFLYHGFIGLIEKNAYLAMPTTITSNNDPVKEAGNTEQPTAQSEIKGIDVSHYQGSIQWQEVATGFDFAFIKATEGTNYADPNYAVNIRNISDTDMAYGAYHFFSPSADPVKQAEHFIQTTSNIHLSLPPVLDIEVEPSDSSSDFIAAIQQWLTHVESTVNCRPIIYTNKHFWDRHLNDHFSNYPLWISDYTTHEQLLEDIPWQFWQYSEQGQVKGIANAVDQNRFRGNLSALYDLKCD